MNTFSKILLLCALIPTCIFNNKKDTQDFYTLIQKHSSTWKALPNNIKYHITFSVLRREDGLEEPHRSLSQHLAGIADYLEYLEPKSYVANKSFWYSLYALFSRDSMELNRHEGRLCIKNKDYLEHLPTTQQHNYAHLNKMLSGATKPPGFTAHAQPASSTRQIPAGAPKYVDWTAKYNSCMKNAAQDICDLLRQQRKLEAKQKVLMHACLQLKLHHPMNKLETTLAKSNEEAIREISTNYAAYLRQRIFMHYGDKKCSAYLLGQAFSSYGFYEHNGMLTQFSVTPIWNALKTSDEDEAVSLTIKLIKNVALQVKKRKSSSRSTSTSRPSSADQKTSSSRKPTGTKKPSTKMPPDNKQVVRLEDIGEAPLAIFAGH